MLEATGTSMGGGTLVLVSDGKETKSPNIVDVTPILIQKGVIVHTAVFRNNTGSELLIKLAAATKGTAFDESGFMDSTGLWDAFRKTETEGPRDASIEVCGLSVCRGVCIQ